MPVLVRNRVRRPAIRTVTLARLSQRILVSAGAPKAELSLELIGDRRMRRLNRTYRGQDRTTDVLAFPLPAGPGPRILGDVVISVPAAARQANARGHALARELTVLLIHGVLHLLGYDHERGDREARRMARRERALLRSLRPLPKLVERVAIRHPSIVIRRRMELG